LRVSNPIFTELQKHASAEKAANSTRFFKTGKGDYGENDKFLGVTVPEVRVVAKLLKDLDLPQITQSLKSGYHEERLCALIMLVNKYRKSKSELERKQIYDLYLAHTKYINNWDLVDTSAEHIVGAYLQDKSKQVLHDLAHSQDLWERRIAMLSTFHYIRQGEASTALEIAEILVNDNHDLIHKAVGWMLREIGEKCSLAAEMSFLEKHHKTMPRTMLRYAIEKFSPEERKRLM
jgi:3-methyladenine DNA glycosylase AlkD